MGKHEEFSDKALGTLFWCVGVGAVGWGLSQAAGATGIYIVRPMVQAMKAYFIAYGRVTAEVVTVISIAWLQKRHEKKVVSRVIDEFHTLKNELIMENAYMKSNRSYFEENNKKMSLQLNDAFHNTNSLKSQIKVHEADKITLSNEIERLKQPEEVAFREKIQGQVLNDQELENIVGGITWGKT